MRSRTRLFSVLTFITLLIRITKYSSAEDSLSCSEPSFNDFDGLGGESKGRKRAVIRRNVRSAQGRDLSRFLKNFFNRSINGENEIVVDVKGKTIYNEHLDPVKVELLFERKIPTSNQVCSSIQLMSFWRLYSHVIKTVYFEMFNEPLGYNNDFGFDSKNRPDYATDNCTTSELIEREIANELNDTNVHSHNAKNGDGHDHLHENSVNTENENVHSVDNNRHVSFNMYTDENVSFELQNIGESIANQNRASNSKTEFSNTTNSRNALLGTQTLSNFSDGEFNNTASNAHLVLEINEADILSEYNDTSQSPTGDHIYDPECTPDVPKTHNKTYLQIGFHKYIID